MELKIKSLLNIMTVDAGEITDNLKKERKADFTVREVYFPIFRKARPFFFRVCLRLTHTLQFKQLQ